MKKMNAIEPNVMTLLRSNPLFRNNDMALIIAYWHTYDNLDAIDPNAESYVNCVRGLTAVGSITSTDPEVKRKRDEHRKDVIDYVTGD